MPEPEVRYCTTDDGVRIAYTVTGSGPPLLFLSEPVVSHVQLEWSQPVFGRMFERLARDNTLIRFDARGTGLSDHVIVTDPGAVEPRLFSDLESIVAKVGLESFALGTVQSATPNCLRFVAQHPDRVTRLCIVDGFLRMRDLFGTPQIQALMAAAASDFQMATEAIGSAAFGPGREESREYGAYIRSCIGPEFFGNTAVVADVDASDAAARLAVPTLVVRHAGLQYVTDDMTRDLVARIPDARLVTVPGAWADDPEGLAAIIAAFINEREAPSRASSGTQSGVLTVLFTDLVSSTALTQRLGDAKAQELVRAHNAIVREALGAHSGNEIKHTGDGIMASFQTASGALECAAAIQRTVAARDDANLQVHIGVNAGEPVAEDADLFGTSVQLARRICDHAEAGQVLASNVVRELAAGKGFLFADIGDTALRGFEDPVRLYEVRWQD
jgi:class 3 adenylate cyclase/pimeloyl-ACP methyl ester carboxylesterase